MSNKIITIRLNKRSIFETSTNNYTPGKWID